MDLYKVREERVVTFYNGYDESIFFPFEVDVQEVLDELGLKISQHHTFVSFAGKISKTKGIDILLQANLLMNREDIHFLILGGGKPKEFINKHFPEGIDTSRVHFLGHLSPRMVARVHNICRISTLPSRSEGFGIACLEAMACGLPVVVTRTGGLKEMAVGTFVEVENSLELAEAIVEVVDLPKQKFQSLRKEALERVKEYSWKKIASLRLDLYQEALERD